MGKNVDREECIMNNFSKNINILCNNLKYILKFILKFKIKSRKHCTKVAACKLADIKE